MNNKIEYSTAEDFVLPLADKELLLREYTLTIGNVKETFTATLDAALSYAVIRSVDGKFSLKRDSKPIKKSSNYPVTTTKQYKPSPSF